MAQHSRIELLGNALNASNDNPSENEIGADARRIWTATVVRRLGGREEGGVHSVFSGILRLAKIDGRHALRWSERCR